MTTTPIAPSDPGRPPASPSPGNPGASNASGNSPAGRRAPAVAAGVAAGLAVPVQARLNGELSHHLNDGIAAAALSFCGGLVLMTLLALLSPRMRRSMGTLKDAARGGQLPRRYLLAGVLGGTFALAQSTVALVTGIAVFTVSAIAGQTLSGLIVDARGIGGGLRQRPGGARLAGAGIVLVAAVVSALPRFASTPDPASVLLPALGALAAGFLLGLQQAMNGASTAASGSPLAATWLNFLVGAIVLALAWSAKTLVRGSAGTSLPTDWWVYLGGVCGVVFIAASAFLVRRIGVLLLGMASIAGQLAGSIALDLLAPSAGHGPSALTFVGAVLTFTAVWIASRRARVGTSRSAGGHRRGHAHV